MVVPQVIDPNRAAAQSWSQIFHIFVIIFYGWKKSPYKILSKSVEKQKSYGMVLPVQFAPEERYENDNVRKSPLLNITHLNPFLNAIVIPPGIF